MLQLQNSTPFSAATTVFANEQGIDTLFVLVKARFTMGPQLTLHAEQAEPQAEDVYFGEAGHSSLKLPSDFHPGKPASDILMVGSAYSPEGRAVSAMNVGFCVGPISKTLRVTGDRVWLNGQASQVAAFESMPMIYERAYGGVHDTGERVYMEERNPVGVGFCGKNKPRDMEGLALPNIEYPDQLMQRCGDTSSPAGFTAVAPSWLPRKQYAGTYDQNWQQTRAPFLPMDYDSRFCNLAPSDQIFAGYLKGGEPVMVKGMHPSGEIACKVPSVNLSCKVDRGGEIVELPLNIETLILEPNELAMSLVWKASYPCDKHVLTINTISLQLVRS